jgi:hypothetical protein
MPIQKKLDFDVFYCYFSKILRNSITIAPFQFIQSMPGPDFSPAQAVLGARNIEQKSALNRFSSSVKNLGIVLGN